MTYPCPKGHDSTDDDYCSVCGTRLTAPSVATATAASLPSGAGGSAPSAATLMPADGGCPDCGTPRTLGMRFCEVCRFDFNTGASHAAVSPPAVSAASTVVLTPTPGAASPVAPPVATDVAPQRLMAVICVDASLYVDPEPDIVCPVGAPERKFHLDLDENLVGRPSRSRGIFPELPVDDVGASHRHVKFLADKDGGYSALDMSSANGTRLNGVDLQPGIPVKVHVGDELTLGMWTRIRIAAR